MTDKQHGGDKRGKALWGKGAPHRDVWATPVLK